MSEFAAMNAELGISKLQALMRGKKTSEGEYSRAKAGATILCPHYASPPSVIEAILSLVGNKLDDADSLFYDLGCGDGTVLIGVASALHNTTCIGIDVDATLCATARRKRSEVETNISDRITIRQEDLAQFSFSSNDEGDCIKNGASPSVVFAFLVPSCLKILSGTILKDLEKGTILLSYKFPLPEVDGWVSEQTWVCVVCFCAFKLNISNFIISILLMYAVT